MGIRLETSSTTTRRALKIRGWVAPLTLCIPLMMACASSRQSIWRFDAPSADRSGVEHGHRTDPVKPFSFAHNGATERGACVRIWRLHRSGLWLLSLCKRVLLGSDALCPHRGFRAEALSARLHSQRVRLRDRRLVALRGRQYWTCPGNQPIGRDDVPETPRQVRSIGELCGGEAPARPGGVGI